MTVYVIYTSYSSEDNRIYSGSIHGIFESKDLAERYLNDNYLGVEFDNSYIEEIELNEFSKNHIYI